MHQFVMCTCMNLKISSNIVKQKIIARRKIQERCSDII